MRCATAGHASFHLSVLITRSTHAGAYSASNHGMVCYQDLDIHCESDQNSTLKLRLSSTDPMLSLLSNLPLAVTPLARDPFGTSLLAGLPRSTANLQSALFTPGLWLLPPSLRPPGQYQCFTCAGLRQWLRLQGEAPPPGFSVFEAPPARKRPMTPTHTS